MLKFSIYFKSKLKFIYLFNHIISIYLIINLFFLIINIYFLLETKNCILKIKNVDFFSFSFIKKTYKDEEKYLVNKYNTNINSITIKKNNYSKKKVKFYAIGNKFKKTYIKRIVEGLKKNFIFEFTPHNPDYLIYDVYKCDFLYKRYDNAIKIAFYSENMLPDFNKADYAVGFHNLNYLDRYYRRTALISVFESRYINMKNKDLMRIKLNSSKNIENKKFCAAVISNYNNSDGFRLQFIKELNKYKKVDLYGGHGINITKGKESKINILKLYKFSIAMENSEGEGYISEKIIDSFLAGTIPIYYGGYNINQYINNKAFILIRGEKDLKKKIEYIKKIDNNDRLYKSILNENIIVDDNFVLNNKNDKIEFIKHIFEQEKNMGKRIDNYNWNING